MMKNSALPTLHRINLLWTNGLSYWSEDNLFLARAHVMWSGQDGSCKWPKAAWEFFCSQLGNGQGDVSARSSTCEKDMIKPWIETIIVNDLRPLTVDEVRCNRSSLKNCCFHRVGICSFHWGSELAFRSIWTSGNLCWSTYWFGHSGPVMHWKLQEVLPMYQIYIKFAGFIGGVDSNP